MDGDSMVSHLTHLDIGLTGSAGAGKDTAAQALVELGYARVAFADQVRALALRVNPLVHINRMTGGHYLKLDEVLYDWGGWERAKRDVPAVRALLEALGQGVRDIIGPDAWLDAGLRIADRHHTEGRPCVFTDVRYPNEAQAVGVLVRIERPGVEATHPSDLRALELRPQITVYNRTTPEDLQEVLLASLMEDYAWMRPAT